MHVIPQSCGSVYIGQTIQYTSPNHRNAPHRDIWKSTCGNADMVRNLPGQVFFVDIHIATQVRLGKHEKSQRQQINVLPKHDIRTNIQLE